MTISHQGFEKFCSDKSYWPDGPWKDEPDDLEWVDEETGYTCMILRKNEMGGFLNGYVELPKDHPEYGKNSLTDSDIDVHGGITYHNTTDTGSCYVGFDCAHICDRQPYNLAEIMDPVAYLQFLSGLPYEQPFGTYKDINFVKAECAKLAKALKDMENPSK